MKAEKRILSIEVKHIDDTDPDTSYLGTYARNPGGDYSIDRKHTADCILNNPHITETSDKLDRILSYLWARGREIGNNSEDPCYWGISEAQDLIGEAKDLVNECNCGESGNWSHGELQFFNTSGYYKGESRENIVQYTKQDYAHMESYNNGDWGFIGIRAEAEIVIGSVHQRITSGGLWGIESDSDESYLHSIEQDELTELRGILHELGFSKRAIAAAVKASK